MIRFCYIFTSSLLLKGHNKIKQGLRQGRTESKGYWKRRMCKGDTSWKARNHRAQNSVNVRQDWQCSFPKINFMWWNWVSRVFRFTTLISILLEPEELQILLACLSTCGSKFCSHTTTESHDNPTNWVILCNLYCKNVFHKNMLMTSTFSLE